MRSFSYHISTKVIFGVNSTDEIGKHTQEMGNKVLFHYGQSSIKKSGLYDKVLASLKEHQVEVIELGGVMPNARYDLVLEGIELCKKHQVDSILAVGGGSVIDSAKAIAAGVYVEGDFWDYFMDSKKKITKALPIGAVPTIPAAGSETSDSSVITNLKEQHKQSFKSDLLRPKFAIIDPLLHTTLPPYQTACGISDMLSHLLERYFTKTPNVDYTDRLLEASMQSVLVNGPRVMENPDDIDARSEIALIAMMAHNGILGSGRQEDWATHSIEHEISNFYDIAHGAGLSIVFPAWMRYVYKEHPIRFEQFARRVFGIDFASDEQEKTILAGINAYESFMKSLHLPVRLSEAGIFNDRFEEMAENLFVGRMNRPLGRFKVLDRDDVVNIYKLAR